MKRQNFLSLLLLLLIGGTQLSYAIKPKKDYTSTPKEWGLNYNENTIVSDGVSIKSWYLSPTENRKNITVLLSYADMGNMSYYLFFGQKLYADGYDVILYDYRGFGRSSAFPVDTSHIFYNEYETDLKSVYDFYAIKEIHPKVLMGLSMGTVITTMFLADNNIDNKCLVVYDGFVQNLEKTIAVLNASFGKKVMAPVKYSVYKNDVKKLERHKMLIFSGNKDIRCPVTDMPNADVVRYDGGHLQSIQVLTRGSDNADMANIYFEKIDAFVDKNI